MSLFNRIGLTIGDKSLALGRRGKRDQKSKKNIIDTKTKIIIFIKFTNIFKSTSFLIFSFKKEKLRVHLVCLFSFSFSVKMRQKLKNMLG